MYWESRQKCFTVCSRSTLNVSAVSCSPYLLKSRKVTTIHICDSSFFFSSFYCLIQRQNTVFVLLIRTNYSSGNVKMFLTSMLLQLHIGNRTTKRITFCRSDSSLLLKTFLLGLCLNYWIERYTSQTPFQSFWMLISENRLENMKSS